MALSAPEQSQPSVLSATITNPILNKETLTITAAKGLTADPQQVDVSLNFISPSILVSKFIIMFALQTFRSFFKTYNTMSELCFNQCIWDFGTAELRNRENRCILRCSQTYMEATQSMGKSFAESQEALISSPGRTDN